MAAGDEEVFIVRIWREPREIAGAPPFWRGLIQHVGPTEETTGDTTEQQHFQDLRQIPLFIARYITDPPGPAGVHSRVRQWLTRKK